MCGKEFFISFDETEVSNEKWFIEAKEFHELITKTTLEFLNTRDKNVNFSDKDYKMFIIFFLSLYNATLIGGCLDNMVDGEESQSEKSDYKELQEIMLNLVKVYSKMFIPMMYDL